MTHIHLGEYIYTNLGVYESHTNDHRVECITYALNAYISTYISALYMKACQWSTNDEKAIGGPVLTPVRYETGEWKNLELFLNSSYSYSSYYPSYSSYNPSYSGERKFFELFLIFFLSFLFFFFFVLSKRFIPRQLNQLSRYCCVNNTNEMCRRWQYAWTC